MSDGSKGSPRRGEKTASTPPRPPAMTSLLEGTVRASSLAAPRPAGGPPSLSFLAALDLLPPDYYFG